MKYDDKARSINLSTDEAAAVYGGVQRQLRRVSPRPAAKLKVGDLLWARESFQWIDDVGEGEGTDRGVPKERHGPAAPFRGSQGHRQITWRAVYAADGPIKGIRWMPSVRMERWASRLLLRVSSVRLVSATDRNINDMILEGLVADRFPVTHNHDDAPDGTILVDRAERLAHERVGDFWEPRLNEAIKMHTKMSAYKPIDEDKVWLITFDVVEKKLMGGVS